MALVYLGLGSNLGDKRSYLEQALVRITDRVGDLLALSRFYETSPWGYQSDGIYLNAVVKIETALSPETLLAETQAIETELGRTGKTIDGIYTDRVIDIDLLLYDQRILHQPGLIIPHPRMHERVFVLQPLSEIAPEIVHPVLRKTVGELYNELVETLSC